MDSQNNTAILPKDTKQVVAKTMLSLDISASEIADTLGIHRSSVYRYSDKPTPDDLRHFETELTVLMSIKQKQVLAKIIKQMERIIDDKEADSVSLKALATAYLVLKKTTGHLEDIELQNRQKHDWGELKGEPTNII
jgi:predicted DNA-binding protein YlxM (UPF0122 family)